MLIYIYGIFIFISREIFMHSYTCMLSKKEFGIFSNLRFISMKKSLLSWVEHKKKKKNITSGPGTLEGYLLFDCRLHWISLLYCFITPGSATITNCSHSQKQRGRGHRQNQTSTNRTKERKTPRLAISSPSEVNAMLKGLKSTRTK